MAEWQSGSVLSVQNVSAGGYVWDIEAKPRDRDWGGSGGPFLVPAQPYSGEFTHSPIVASPGLFREFAVLGHDFPERFMTDSLEFAKKHGHLGIAVWVESTHGAETRDGQLAQGESLVDWMRHAFNVARLVDLWDVVRQAREFPKRLTDRIDIRDGVWQIESRLEAPPPSIRGSTVPFTYPPTHPGWEYDRAVFEREDPHFEVEADASRFDGMRSRAMACLAAELNEELVSTSVAPQVFRPEGQGKPEMRLFPVNLLATIYLQLATKVAGETEVSACIECGKWFVPRRSDAKYCSGACRARASRKRH